MRYKIDRYGSRFYPFAVYETRPVFFGLFDSWYLVDIAGTMEEAEQIVRRRQALGVLPRYFGETP